MGADITCVPISFFDHPSIRGAAVLEYGSEGSGVLKDGGGGSCSESACGVGVLVPQAVRDKAQMVNFSAQERFTGSGSIEGLHVGLVDGALVGAGFLDGLELFARGLYLGAGHCNADLGDSSIHACALESPGSGSGHDSGGQVGDEGDAHCGSLRTDSAQRASGTLPSRASAQPTMNMGLFWRM